MDHEPIDPNPYESPQSSNSTLHSTRPETSLSEEIRKTKIPVILLLIVSSVFALFNAYLAYRLSQIKVPKVQAPKNP